MRNKMSVAFVMLAALGWGGCEVKDQGFLVTPTAREMRVALATMLKEQPEISAPELEESLKRPALVRNGMVYIGLWNCDPKLHSFDAAIPGSSITMYEVSGHFEENARGEWKAVPLKVKTTKKQDIGGYWRASDLDTRAN